MRTSKRLWISYSWKDNGEGDVDFIAGELRKKGLMPNSIDLLSYGEKWKGFTLSHNITPIKSLYFQLKGPVTEVLVGSMEGDTFGVACRYKPRN